MEFALFFTLFKKYEPRNDLLRVWIINWPDLHHLPSSGATMRVTLMESCVGVH